MSDVQSISTWLQELKEGNPTAAAKLWDRFHYRLKSLVRHETVPWVTGGAWDDSDVALSAFALFCQGIDQGRYHGVNDRDELWRLLATITLRKARDHKRFSQALKRCGNDLRTMMDSSADVLAGLLDPQPPPDIQMMLGEECQRLLNLLPNSDLQTLALHKLEGYNNDEVAKLMGYTRRTIQRMLVLIRRHWEAEHGIFV